MYPKAIPANEARENVLDALQTVLTPDEEPAGKVADADREHLHFGPGLARAIRKQLDVPAPRNPH